MTGRSHTTIGQWYGRSEMAMTKMAANQSIDYLSIRYRDISLRLSASIVVSFHAIIAWNITEGLCGIADVAACPNGQCRGFRIMLSEKCHFSPRIWCINNISLMSRHIDSEIIVKRRGIKRRCSMTVVKRNGELMPEIKASIEMIADIFCKHAWVWWLMH